MTNPDYIKIAQWLNQIDFYVRKIQEQLEDKVKEQQSKLHTMSEDAEKDF